MTLKINELTSFLDSYNQIKDEKMPLKLAYTLSQIKKEAKNQLTFYTDTSNSYLAQYAELDESGTPKMNESGNGVFLKPETLSEALQKFKELDEFDFSLTDFSIPLSSFENLTLSPSTLTGLLPFLNVDE